MYIPITYLATNYKFRNRDLNLLQSFNLFIQFIVVEIERTLNCSNSNLLGKCPKKHLGAAVKVLKECSRCVKVNVSAGSSDLLPHSKFP